MAIDLGNINTALYTALNANATLQGLIGNPIRMYFQVPRDVTFPFVRVDTISMPYLTGNRLGPGINWIMQYAITFTCFSKDTGLATVNDVNAAIFDVVEDAPALTPTGHAIGMALPQNMRSWFDSDTGTSMGVVEFVLSVEATA